MRSQEKLLIINQMPVFAALSPEDREVVAGASTITEYRKGDIIYKEADPGEAFYCVVTGRLRAYTVISGSEEDVEYLKRGKYFGIISILTGEPHSVTVQAINDSIILSIPKDDFNKILKRVPDLAIYFGQALSRRLRRRDAGVKTIFESTILSVFGASDKIGVTNYAFNLGVGLRINTAKKVILLNVSKTGAKPSLPEWLRFPAEPITLESPFFDERVVKKDILKHRLGIDIASISHDPGGLKHLISLISYLTNDYHYVIVDLPGDMDETAFELLKQSDMIHIVTSSDKESLLRSGQLIDDLAKSHEIMGGKIMVVTSDYGPGLPLPYAARKSILKHDIYATLPDLGKSKYDIGNSRGPIIIEDPGSEYSRMIRRIARQMGDALIGIALGAGAAGGFAHVGILKVIERERIQVDIVVGTSIGALIGALWASGKDASEIENIVAKFKRKIAVLRLIDLTFPKRGLIKGREIRRFLVSQLGDKTFYDLRLPLKIVTCDIEKREEVVLSEGRLVDAIMASIAIPGMFEPVKIDGRILVDGGIINPLPVSVLVKNGVAKIIAVNTLPGPGDAQSLKKKELNIFDMIVRNIQASEYLLAEMSCQDADIAMHPVLTGIDWYELYEGAKIIRRGEEEAVRCLDQLKELALAR